MKRVSCPSRGTWIEISSSISVLNLGCCRAPRGARGLKSAVIVHCSLYHASRAPRGARGLKFKSMFGVTSPDAVVPLAGHVD